jgi:hypothetical protein
MSQILIGADPELFLIDIETNKFASAVGKLGGTKYEPIPIDNLGNMYQEDNVMVEFNIQPSENENQFYNNIQKTLKTLREKLPKFSFSTEATAIFPKEELNSLQAFTFGCEPDFNAYTQTINPKPILHNIFMRTAGGHIHIGCDIAQSHPIELTKACDLFLGVPSTLLDIDVTRRSLYGKAGSFRKKDYGIEYRTLSNFWIFKDYLIKWVYKQTNKAIEFVKNNHKISLEDEYYIQKCINTSNTTFAEHLIEKYFQKPNVECYEQ